MRTADYIRHQRAPGGMGQRRRGRGCKDRQFGIQNQLGTRLLSGQHLPEDLASQIAELLPWDADRTQRRMRQDRERDIVGARDRNVLGNPDA